MTPQEFSIEFDIFYNNLASNTAPPLDEYEKSVFLTKAQSDIVLELYSGRNQLGLSYESSEEVRMYLRPLLHHDSSPLAPNNAEEHSSRKGWVIDTGSYDPFPLVFIREEIKVHGYIIPVVPITQDEFSRIMENPFRWASVRRVLKVQDNIDSWTFYIPSLEENTDITYYCWYLASPEPIILPGIDDPTLTINGVPVTSHPEGQSGSVDPALHRMILERAVLYAKQAYIGGQTQE